MGANWVPDKLTDLRDTPSTIVGQALKSLRANAGETEYEHFYGTNFVNVKDFGAVGDGVTDDTSAIQAAIDSLTVGATIFFPVGTYLVDGEMTVTLSGTQLVGESRIGTVIKQSNLTSDTFKFSSAQFAGVENMRITHTGIPTAGYAVVFDKILAGSGCFFSYAKDLYITGMFDGVLIESCTETRLLGTTHFRSLLGNYCVMFRGTGTGADSAFRAVVEDIVIEATGGNLNIIGIAQDSYSYSLVLGKFTALNSGIGFKMMDTINSGTSQPVWCFATDLECDHNIIAGVLLERGEGFYMTNSWLGSTSAGSGLDIRSTFGGEVSATNSRIMGCAHHGVKLAAGPVDVSISGGCMIGDNSQASPGTYHGFYAAPGATDFKFVDNVSGNLLSGTGPSQGYGAYVATGASDNYIISLNKNLGNLTGKVFDGGAGANKVVANNI